MSEEELEQRLAEIDQELAQFDQTLTSAQRKLNDRRTDSSAKYSEIEQIIEDLDKTDKEFGQELNQLATAVTEEVA